MFQLVRGGNNWYIILMLLSLEKTERFFPFVRFPTQINYPAIRPLARELVEQYGREINIPRYHKDQEAIFQALFESCHAALVKTIGADDTRLLCDWGNRLQLDTPYDDNLGSNWNALTNLRRHWDSIIPNLSAAALQTVLGYIEDFITKWRIFNELDEAIEAEAPDEWEQRATWIYNGSGVYGDKSFTISPFDYLSSLLELVELPAYLRQIKAALSVEDFAALNDWVKAERLKTHYAIGPAIMDLNDLLAAAS